VPAIAANGLNTGATNVTLPAGLTGRYYILVAADGFTSVPESNELNNMVARLITINP
jgi:subtilase family serine protease